MRGLVCLFVVAVGVVVGMVVVVGAILRENSNDVYCWSVFLSVRMHCFEVILFFELTIYHAASGELLAWQCYNGVALRWSASTRLQ